MAATRRGTNTGTAIDRRREIRRFAERPLSPAQFERILDAGRRAGSSKNTQRREFIVCRDRAHLRELAAVGPYAGHVAGAAVAVALVTPDPRGPGDPLSIAFDVGLAAQNMMLAAWELGIGSCPATVYEQDLARDLLGYPESHHCEVPALVRLSGRLRRPDPAAAPRVGAGRWPRSSTRSAGRRYSRLRRYVVTAES